MKFSPFVVLFIAIAIPSLLSPGCRKRPPEETVTSRPSGSNINEVFNVVKRPGKAPEFSWRDSTGKVVNFDAFRGKLVLVNFWATWCGPCKRELPALVELNKEYAGRGVTILGISSDRGANIIDDVRAFVHDSGIPYQVVLSNDELEEAFGNIRALPTSFLINEEGSIVQTFVGGREKQFFAQAITEAMNAPAAR
jgi:thiol-disulfide isomerase/thioredoxin